MARLLKYAKFVLHIGLWMLISYFIKKQKPPTVIKTIQRQMADIRHILMWTRVHGVEEDGQKYFLDHKCEFMNCYFTENRSFLADLRYYDAIVFNVQQISGPVQDIPKVRSLVQKYIFAANDSADNYPVCGEIYENFFNWTWTYKYDSTIRYTFITVYNTDNEHLGTDLHWNYNMKPVSNQFKSSLSSKSQAAAIYLDKCKTTSKREHFLAKLKTELAKYNHTVDVYGPCGTMKCGRKSLKSCFYRIRKTYYFYLALEDSFATDFITKTVLFGYQNNAVPVVFGGARYHGYLPPDSYLDGTQLGAAILAQQMNEAINNKTKYYNFFKWKNHYSFKESPVLNACTLCEALNREGFLMTRISFTRFRHWWNPFFEKRCAHYNKGFLF